MVLALCLGITLLDSVHYRPLLPPAAASEGAAPAYDTRTRSLLDALLVRLVDSREATYSRPLSYVGFTKESVEVDGQVQRVAPRLKFGGAHLQDPATQWLGDLAWRALVGLGLGALVAGLLSAALLASVARHDPRPLSAGRGRDLARRRPHPLARGLPHAGGHRALSGPVALLAGHYHVFGTDLTGNDVLYQALKSIRTAFVIGTLATVATLPLAVGLGILAGYLRGWVDEVIQYLYTVLSSVPNVLLIAACVLMVQVFIDQHPEVFETGAERADLKLFLLCAVLGLTGWAGLCRLLRAETLKLRELEYVQAAQAFGVPDARIMRRHIFPNVAHLMLIVTVLEFSSLILYEAVLSYVGVGVDPSMNSFGGMINLARSEMSRDPVVWWSFAAAFGFMVTLVLAANLFADGVRDAFDPRARVFRPRLRPEEGRPMNPRELLQALDLKVELDAEAGVVRALDGIRLSIERGETFALVGESGCGKSMTALALMRLLPENGRVSDGQVRLGDLDVLGLPEAAMRSVRGARIGMIFQEPSTSLNPVMRVGEQIVEAIETHTPVRGAAARAKAVEWLGRVGITEPERRIDEYPFRLSGGQKQRVMIAMTLAAEPDFLVADEPTTALDVTIQAQILELLRTLQREQRMGLLLITHDLGVVAGMAQRVALMYAGQIIEVAPADQFFAAPKHPYARALLRALPDAARRGQPLQAIAGTVPPLWTAFQGCRFAPRCSLALSACTEVAPELFDAGAQRQVRCLLHAPGAAAAPDTRGATAQAPADEPADDRPAAPPCCRCTV